MRSHKPKIKGYDFSRPIHRIEYQSQIPGLFDEFPRVSGTGSSSYYGKITGIEARIKFSLHEPCILSAKTQEDLKGLYKEIMSALLDIIR